MPAPVYYFGCWNRAGHYLYEPGGKLSGHVAGPFNDCMLDGGFVPKPVSRPGGQRVEDEMMAALTHWRGWSVLAMWDRSVDTRPGCNAAFVAEGLHSHAEMWALAQAHFPQVVARLKAAGPSS